MKKETIVNRINEHEHVDPSKVTFYDMDMFIADARRYIKAIRDGRMVCNINSVAKSGMSRTIAFHECARTNNNIHKYDYLNFYAFFMAMGYTPVNRERYFRIHGCGMDMIFHTNYTIINTLGRLGFLTKEDARLLAQRTPPVL